MRTKCRSIATFHRPIHSHWSLPLSNQWKHMQIHPKRKIHTSLLFALLCFLILQITCESRLCWIRHFVRTYESSHWQETRQLLLGDKPHLGVNTNEKTFCCVKSLLPKRSRAKLLTSSHCWKIPPLLQSKCIKSFGHPDSFAESSHCWKTPQLLPVCNIVHPVR
jgi:hypothetical protein